MTGAICVAPLPWNTKGCITTAPRAAKIKEDGMLLGVGSSTTMTVDKQFGFFAVEPASRLIKFRCYPHTWIVQPYVLLFKFDKCCELRRKSAVTDTILKLVGSAIG